MKNRSCKLFSLGLYLESLRQLRLMGLTYLLLCLVFSALQPILSGTSWYGTRAFAHAAVLFGYDFIAPVTLAFLSFGYLSRRNASDFYHSLPVTREAAFFARTLAMLTYGAATIALSLLLSFLLYDLAGAVNWLQLPGLISYHLLCFLLVLACTLIGLSLTGTRFAALVVTGVVLFLPRMILVVVAMMAARAGIILSPDSMGLLLNVNFNLPVSLIAALFTGGTYQLDPSGYLFYLPSHLYTLALSLVYLVAGCALHHFRRSELAGTAAPNRVLQHVTRCLISLPLFLIIGAAIRCDADGDTLTMLTVCALLVYFLYELITTRKVRNLLPALAVLPIVAALGLGIPWVGSFIGQRELNRCPDMQDIESVSFDPYLAFEDDGDYTLCRLSRLRHDDPELIELAHEVLERTVAYYTRSDSASTPVSARMQVCFRLKGGRTLTRSLRLTPEQLSRLNRLRAQDPAFLEVIETLPESRQVAGLSLMNHWFTEGPLPQMQDLWDTFREEYAALPVEQRLTFHSTLGAQDLATPTQAAPIAESRSQAAFDAALGQETFSTGYSLHASFTEGVHSYSGDYELTSLTPRALLKAMRITNAVDTSPDTDASDAMAEGLAELRDFLAQEREQGGELYLYGSLCLYDPSGADNGSVELHRGILGAGADPDTRDDYYVPRSFLSTYDALLSILQRGSTDIQDLNSPIVYVGNLGFDNYEQGRGYSVGCAFLRLTEEDFSQLLDLVRSTEETQIP